MELPQWLHYNLLSCPRERDLEISVDMDLEYISFLVTSELSETGGRGRSEEVYLVFLFLLLLLCFTLFIWGFLKTKERIGGWTDRQKIAWSRIISSLRNNLLSVLPNIPQRDLK